MNQHLLLLLTFLSNIFCLSVSYAKICCDGSYMETKVFPNENLKMEICLKKINGHVVKHGEEKIYDLASKAIIKNTYYLGYLISVDQQFNFCNQFVPLTQQSTTVAPKKMVKSDGILHNIDFESPDVAKKIHDDWKGLINYSVWGKPQINPTKKNNESRYYTYICDEFEKNNDDLQKIEGNMEVTTFRENEKFSKDELLGKYAQDLIAQKSINIVSSYDDKVQFCHFKIISKDDYLKEREKKKNQPEEKNKRHKAYEEWMRDLMGRFHSAVLVRSPQALEDTKTEQESSSKRKIESSCDPQDYREKVIYPSLIPDNLDCPKDIPPSLLALFKNYREEKIKEIEMRKKKFPCYASIWDNDMNAVKAAVTFLSMKFCLLYEEQSMLFQQVHTYEVLEKVIHNAWNAQRENALRRKYPYGFKSFIKQKELLDKIRNSPSEGRKITRELIP